MRLDPQQLESAKQAVESFVAERQPDEAVTTKTWNEVVSAPAKRKASR
jgi:hypothetical protein